MANARQKSVLLKFLLHLHPPRIPASSARFTYTFGLGGLVFLSFIITMVTGVLLLFVYSPNPILANQSLQIIATVLPYGWYVRNLHYWAGQIMAVAVILHLLRVAATGGYLGNRRTNWIFGIILLVLTFFMDFTGFPLRWDTESHWALVVGTNLLKSIPWVGRMLHNIVVGGDSVSGQTLLRFYTWHIFALPFVAFFLTIYHFWRIRKDGGISASTHVKRSDTITGEELFIKELAFFLVVSIILTLLSVFFSPYLGISAEKHLLLSHVNAPWIFLWVQWLLRYLSPFVAGILLPFLLLVTWLLIPYADRHDDQIGIGFARQRSRFWMIFFASNLIILLLTFIELLY